MGKESPGCGVPRTEGSVYSGYRDTQEVRDVFPPSSTVILTKDAYCGQLRGLKLLMLMSHACGFGSIDLGMGL